jgi:hypothetical protein
LPARHQSELLVELQTEEAWALAELLKRISYSDYRALAVDDDEAETMRDAGERIRAALARQGYAPR